MKALTYHGPGHRTWGEVPEPRVEDPQDAVVRVDAASICGTDLHILKGDVPEVAEGTVLGHEAVGTVTATGAAVRDIAEGDRVLISCITACGRCRYCRQARYGQCLRGGGWILGHTVHGTQAERVRVPFADSSVHRLPETVTDEAALMLADILPTSYEVGVRNGCVSPGDTVVIVGAGPIGLAAVMTARLYSPARVVVVDPDGARLDAAKRLGADITLRAAGATPEILTGVTPDGLGADVAIEAVGIAETFELCTRVVRPGGHVANIGVHGAPAALHLEDLWIRDVTITTGLVDTSTTARLLDMLTAGQLDPSSLVTHRFGLGEMREAYDVFAQAAENDALKVALFRT